ncbi:hypothetical protein [Parabacteroides sp.]
MLEQSKMNKRKIMVIASTIIIGLSCLYSLYLIYKGGLKFDENPISLDLTEGRLFMVLIALWVPLSFILTTFETFTVLNIDRYGHSTEDGAEGCMMNLMFALIKPIVLALITYYVLWLLLQVLLFLLPYLSSILLVAGIYLLYLWIKDLYTHPQLYPLVLILILGLAVYLPLGYYLHMRVHKQDSNPYAMTEQTEYTESLEGTWLLVSQKREQQILPSTKKTQLIFTGVKDEQSNSYELIESINGEKFYSSYILQAGNRVLVTSLRSTKDTNDNYYTITECDEKHLILRFSYQPYETDSGELVFER